MLSARRAFTFIKYVDEIFVIVAKLSKMMHSLNNYFCNLESMKIKIFFFLDIFKIRNTHD